MVAEEMQAAEAARVWDLRPVTYRATETVEEADTFYGFVAEEVAKIDPRLVHWGQDDEGQHHVEGVDYDRVVTLLLHQTRALKEAHDMQIKALKEDYEAQKEAHEKRFTALEERLLHN